MAFIKSLTRFLSSKPSPRIELAAFGKHPGWNDHTDDLGLDTEALVNAKRLLYMQGISQNIDAGSWENLEAAGGGGGGSGGGGGVTEGRLELFRHDFLWHMPPNVLLAGRLWSSVDGKGRDKYPMVGCVQLTDWPAPFASKVVLPFLADFQALAESATTAGRVSEIVEIQRERLRERTGEAVPLRGLTPGDVAAVANHPDMLQGRVGFHRIVYGFASTLGDYRVAVKAGTRRTEQLRLPTCGMSPPDALLFWLRFALTILDMSTPLLLFAQDLGEKAPWVDLIAGEPGSSNLFCIKAGTKAVPMTSDIPYTLHEQFVRALDNFVGICATAPEGAALPEWPM